MTLIVRTPREMSQRTAEARRAGKRVALVPTMGFLHEGHLSLMREAKKRAEYVVTSLFVNPTQFGPKEDLERYPRDFEGDRQKCESVGVDVLFAPEVEAIYPRGFQTFVEVTEVSQGLCGERRPGHFRGVATVVTKLFNMVRPDVALFGQKDFQQLQVIRALARDLDMGVEVVGLPTVRERDGLAMSSRNAYLSSEERERALSLSRGLRSARHLFQNGPKEPGLLEDAVRRELHGAQVREDYVAVVDAETLRPLENITDGRQARVLVAAFLGQTRLIDNMPLADES